MKFNVFLEDARVQARKQHEEIIHEANIRANGMIEETAQSEINSEKRTCISGY